MATSTERNATEDYVDFDEYISFQLERTRSNVRLTDVLTAGVGAAAMGVLYLLAFVILDHWAIPGGLSQVARTSMLLLLIVATIGWLVWKLAVPYMRHVNALFAARLIEKSHPELKSSLLNLVDLERSGREIPEDIRRAIEKRAAVTLSHVDVDQSVDRRMLMRLSYALFIAVVLFCLYTVLSPKKPWSSLWRALAPASEVAVSTRTEILRVTPEDTEVLARSQLEVLVDLRGEIPEKTYLYYTTVDNKFVDEPIEMRLVDDATKQFRAIVTGENGRGLLQSMTYRIEAGDAKTRDFRVTVIQPPSATVESLHYEYPAYMEMSPSTVPGGNLDSWEGATVTLTGRANTPVRSATLRFSDTEDVNTRAEEVTGKVAEGTKLSAKWKLVMRSDGTHPHFYHVQCRNDKGETDPEPILYSVRIRADQPPDIALVNPKGDLERPANAIIPLVIDARDPDFKLRRINLRIEKDGEELIGPEIFEGNQQSHQGSFDWNLGAMSLKTGDTISFWIEAQDNKQPIANRKNTPKLRIRITDPVSKDEVQKQLADEKKQLDNMEQQAGEPGQGEQPNKDEKAAEGGNKPPQKEEKNAAAREADDRNKEPQKNSDEKAEPGKEAGEKVADDQSGRKEGDGTREKEQQDRQQPFDPESSDDVGEVLEKIAERQKQKEQEEQKTGEEQNSNDGNSGDEGKPDAKGSNEKSEQKDKQAGSEKMRDEPGAPKDDGTGESQPKESPKNDGFEKKNNDSNGGSKKSGEKPKANDGKSPSDEDPGNENGGEKYSGDKKGKTGDSPDKQKDEPGKSNDKSKDSRDKQADDKQDPANKEKGKGKSANDADSANADKNSQKDMKETDGNKRDGKTQPPNPEPDPREKKDAETKDKQGEKNGDKKNEDPGNKDSKAKSNPKSDPQQNKAKKDDNRKEDGGGGDEKSEEASNDSDKSDSQEKNSKADQNPEESSDSQQEKNKDAKNQSKDAKSSKSDASEKPNGTPEEGEKSDPSESQNAADKSASKDSPDSSEKTPSKDAKPSKPQADSAKAKNKPEAKRDKQAATDRKSDDEKPQGDEKSPPNDAAKNSDKQQDRENAPKASAKDDTPKDPKDAAREQRKQQREAGKKNQPPKSDDMNSKKGSDAGKSKQDASSQKGDEASQQGKQDGEKSKGEASQPSDKKGAKSQEKGGAKGTEGAGKGESGEGKGMPAEKSSAGKKTGGAVGKGGIGSDDAEDGVDGNNGNGMADKPGEQGKGEGEVDPEPNADEADLEAAKKATNLVLRKLEDDLKRGEVDEKLLEELGWTKEQMQKFTEQLKKQLESPELEDSAAARARQRQFEETLKSLNFNSRASKRTGADVKKRATDEVGPRRTPPPAEYREYYEAFTRSLSKQGAKTPPKTNGAEKKK